MTDSMIPPPDSSKSEQTTFHPANDGDPHGSHREAESPVLPDNKEVPAQGSQSDSTDKKNRTNNEPPDTRWRRPDILSLIFDGILTATAVIGTLFFYVQYRQTADALEETRKANVAANQSATAAIESNRIAQDSLKLTQRAWVGVMGPIQLTNTRIVDGSLITTATVRVRNVGPVPAFKVIVSPSLAIGDRRLDEMAQGACSGADDAFERQVKDSSGANFRLVGRTIFPNQELSFGTRFDSDFGALDKDGLFIVGCIAYEDTWSVRRHTQFCFGGGSVARQLIGLAEAALGECYVYNWAD